MTGKVATGIINGGTLFTNTVSQFSDKDSGNTNWVISEIFRAMNTRLDLRPKSDLRNWANSFPYLNGGLFSGGADLPRFSKIARSHLLPSAASTGPRSTPISSAP